MDIWRQSRRKTFYRKLLREYGHYQICHINYPIDKLIMMLKEIKSNDNQIKQNGTSNSKM